MSDAPRPIQADTLSTINGIRHGFFTREGGVSTGLYAGLNVGFGSNDDRDAVATNRARVSAALGFPQAAITTLHQVHSAIALEIDQPLEGDLPKADALVTQTPGVIIGALAADCTPVLFCDPVTRTIGAAHAGWRGAVGGVLEATVAKMEELGADRSNIRAAVGPTINQQKYEVGPEFEAEFVSRDASNAQFFAVPTDKDRAHFDLPGFVAHQLAQS
ncbi:MAG: polyphenol oxidase family protein, partial [Pseudomonadota bacterium]